MTAIDCNRKTKPERQYAFLWHHLLGIITAAALAPAFAQANQGRQIEEVMVTAQKKQESLQDVPISISVVGSEEISALSIFDFAETAALTPGVDVFPGVQSAAIRLRGVGPIAYALTSPQSVAVFIDEIAQGSVGAAFATLVDIERVELLRGPQGTLYGQNAPGGAYNISTRAPNTQELEGYVEASYGQQGSSDLESIDVRGAINLPLIDEVLAVRLAGVFADSDGFLKVKNPANPESSSGGKEHEMLRARMLWNINSDMDLTLTANYKDLTDNGVDFNIEGLVPGTGGANPFPAVQKRFKDNDYYGDFNSEAITEQTDIAGHFRWAHDAINIDILASWQDFDTFNLDNRTPYPGFDNSFGIQLDWETETAELRFSNSGDTLDYIFGYYYAKREIDGFFNVDLSGVNLEGPAIGAGDINAVFANLTYHLNDKWDVTAGARYDKNEIWSESNFSFLNFNSVVDDDVEFDNLSWSFKLRHFISKDHTAYLAIDSAYKQGGFNNLVPGLLALEPVFPALGEVAREMLLFDEETSLAYELGIKGVAAEGRMTYSLAVFYQEFEDHQISQPAEVRALVTPLGDLNALFANQLTNAEEIVSKGIEGEVTYLLGEHWDVSARLAYFDANIEEWSFRFCPPGEEQTPDQLFCPTGNGDALNPLPKWNGNFQLGHQRPLSESVALYGRLNWTWQSPANITGETNDFRDAKSVFGLSGGLMFSNGLNVRVWGKNVFNKELNIDPILLTNGDPGSPEPLRGRYYPGRQYGLTLSFAF
ncbi:MAG: TonB-dependent receptor [Halioglobus sp.]